jgi:hypothetical protein
VPHGSGEDVSFCRIRSRRSWEHASVVVSSEAAFLPLTLGLLLSCSLTDFDYLSNQYDPHGTAGANGTAGAAAGAPANDSPCARQADGTPCDDRNVCTLSSLCVSGACQGMPETGQCVVADSKREFSMIQDLEGWSYGYYRASADPDGEYQPDTDFQRLVACADDIWRPACVALDSPDYRWTLIMAELQHSSVDPELQLSVRRWVSSVSGPASVSIDHHHADAGDGDGTRAVLLVDGVAIWENEISGSDTLGVQASVPITLEAGTRVELMLHPRANQARDMTYVTVVIGSR